MKKQVILDPDAQETFHKLPSKVQKKFATYIDVLSEEGFLKFPEGRKITRDIFEVRVRVGGAWRGLYAYIEKDKIIILHIFQKKKQRTPIKEIHIAEQRLTFYKQQYD